MTPPYSTKNTLRKSVPQLPQEADGGRLTYLSSRQWFNKQNARDASRVRKKVTERETEAPTFNCEKLNIGVKNLLTNYSV